MWKMFPKNKVAQCCCREGSVNVATYFLISPSGALINFDNFTNTWNSVFAKYNLTANTPNITG